MSHFSYIRGIAGVLIRLQNVYSTNLLTFMEGYWDVYRPVPTGATGT